MNGSDRSYPRVSYCVLYSTIYLSVQAELFYHNSQGRSHKILLKDLNDSSVAWISELEEMASPDVKLMNEEIDDDIMDEGAEFVLPEHFSVKNDNEVLGKRKKQTTVGGGDGLVANKRTECWNHFHLLTDKAAVAMAAAAVQVYHSSFVDDEGITKACGCSLLPLKRHIKGFCCVDLEGLMIQIIL
ncbi:hypothetical protein Vadar_007314 [Vaccinium darrowii]|uniref:Uncharacterized protein n=1 Tax=Vaccinium darrowii TaxID=229202 RepID=A0ACB7WYE0_9ERIC|nr:hypothetical protein Vadar_007314 [Vaccinium darrowii]